MSWQRKQLCHVASRDVEARSCFHIPLCFSAFSFSVMLGKAFKAIFMRVKRGMYGFIGNDQERTIYHEVHLL